MQTTARKLENSDNQNEAADKAAKLLVDEILGQSKMPRIDIPNVTMSTPKSKQKSQPVQRREIFVENQVSGEHGNEARNVGNGKLKTTAKTIVELLRRNKLRSQVRHANSPPPQLLLDNTRDERLLMRFVRTL